MRRKYKRYITIVLTLVLVVILATIMCDFTKEESFVKQIKGGISNYYASGSAQKVTLNFNGGTMAGTSGATSISIYVNGTGVYSSSSCAERTRDDTHTNTN